MVKLVVWREYNLDQRQWLTLRNIFIQIRTYIGTSADNNQVQELNESMEVFTQLKGTEQKKESEIKRIIRRLWVVFPRVKGSMNFKDTDEQIKTSDALVSAINVNPSPSSDTLIGSPSLVGVSNGFRKIWYYYVVHSSSS